MSPFEILGIKPDASSAEVLSAYRAAAKKTHPDLNPGDADAGNRFNRVREAYQAVLDILADRRSGMRDGGPTQIDVTRYLDLTIAEIIAGGEYELPGSSGDCPTCTGNGYVRTSHRVACHVCAGTGLAGYHERGIIRIKVACNECGGSGHGMKMWCEDCCGSGRSSLVPARVKVPPGTVHKTVITIVGGADDRENNRAGDLHVVIRHKHDPDFRVHNGGNIETTLTLDVWDAALGCRAQIPLPAGGSLSVNIPPGTQPGKRLRLSRHGMPDSDGRPADLLVLIAVRVPSTETHGVREALLRLKSVATSG